MKIRQDGTDARPMHYAYRGQRFALIRRYATSTPHIAVAVEQIWRIPSNTCFIRPTRVYTQTASPSVQPFLHSSRLCPTQDGEHRTRYVW